MKMCKVPEGDYIAKKTDMYYVSIDPSGRLGWKSSTLTYIDTTAHVIEVLTEKATMRIKLSCAGSVFPTLLQEAKVMDGDSIWLRYLVKNVKEN